MTSQAQLFRMIYLSRNEIAGDAGVIDEEVRRILAASRRNNMRAGVTGSLMFSGDSFLQTLEGDEAAVWQVFDRISLDPRHSGAELLEACPVQERTFTDWSMAYSGLVEADRERFAALLKSCGQGGAEADAGGALVLLRGALTAAAA